jgi:multidrug efflux system membrane fusion protein
VDRDSAAILSAKARLELAQLQETRMTKLMQTQAISQEEVDNANSQLDITKADVLTAEATLKQAQVDLDHCYVTAPISGRTSRAEVTLGNLVQTGSSAPLLTTIVSQDSIYADFDVDEQTYVNAIRAHAGNPTDEQKIPVALVVNGDTDHVYKGFIQNFDNQIDSSSGTIRARAKFDNADKALAPGMFVTVRLASSDMESVILVPERAISFDQNKKSVMVVDNTNHVVFKEVTLGRQVGSNRIVEHGLAPGDKVIVDGLQHIRPSDEVVPHEVSASLADAAKN